MKKTRRRGIMIVAITVVGLAVIGFAGYMAYNLHRLSQLTEMSFQDMVEYTAKNKADAVITVGIIKDGQITKAVYGENGTKLSDETQACEIGSLTKTFTAALIAKAQEEGRLSISSSIDKYLDLPEKDHYPTIEEILTHTSGYKAYYFEPSMISTHLKGKNDFYGVSKGRVLKKLSLVNIKDKKYPFKYSNFGYAALGLVLENVYGMDYTSLVNEFASKEFGLKNTRISDGAGEKESLNNYWDWKADDGYLPAGGLVSNIDDMLKYAGVQLEGKNDYISKTHEVLEDIDSSSTTYKKMGIHMDSIGMAWIIDKENNIVWHNGGTGGYNCYMGLDLNKGMAVVVLSNLPPDYKIPATVMGVKLMTFMQGK